MIEHTDSGEGAARYAVGEACGVCRFPVGPGQICGNPVYANVATGGALPKYCGQEGQAQWQAQHGTDGNPGHLSDRAGYPRRRLQLTKDDVARLADEEAARRGIGRRKAETASVATVSAPIADAVTAPAAPSEQAPTPGSAVDAFADLAQAITQRVAAVRAEMDALRTDCQTQMADTMAERERLAEDVATQIQGLEQDRAQAQAITERAAAEIQKANEARLRAEGELSSALRRIAELEQALLDASNQHRAEIAEVREREEARYDRMVSAFAQTVRTEPEPPSPEDTGRPPSESALTDMGRLVRAGKVTRREGWHTGNGPATRPAARTLDWMLEQGLIAIGEAGEGMPAPVTLTGNTSLRV